MRSLLGFLGDLGRAFHAWKTDPSRRTVCGICGCRTEEH